MPGVYSYGIVQTFVNQSIILSRECFDWTMMIYFTHVRLTKLSEILDEATRRQTVHLTADLNVLSPPALKRMCCMQITDGGFLMTASSDQRQKIKDYKRSHGLFNLIHFQT
jgi:hypothetical protein